MAFPTRGEIARVYDEIAGEYDRSRRRPWPEVVAFAESLPPRTLVADLGCGGGRHAKVFVERGHAVVGLDVSGRLLAIARSKLPGASFAVGDLPRLPFRDGCFRAALAVATIHHLPSEEDRRAAVRELARVLRIGGTAILTVWALEPERAGTRRETRPAGPDPRDVWVPWRASGGEVQRFYHIFAEQELPALARGAGFSVVKYFRSADNYVAIVERHG